MAHLPVSYNVSEQLKLESIEKELFFSILFTSFTYNLSFVKNFHEKFVELFNLIGREGGFPNCSEVHRTQVRQDRYLTNANSGLSQSRLDNSILALIV